jgi:hypothetical protein
VLEEIERMGKEGTGAEAVTVVADCSVGEDSPTPPSSTCADSLGSDVMVLIGVNSINPDEVGIVALADCRRC